MAKLQKIKKSKKTRTTQKNSGFPEDWKPPALEDLNHTELMTLCRLQGSGGASRDIPREILIKVLEGEEPPEVIGDVTTRYRKAIDKFATVYKIDEQLRCDKDHEACPPARVLECFRAASPEVTQYVE
jgi:hypothetical protein